MESISKNVMVHTKEPYICLYVKAYNYPLIQKNGYTKEYATHTSLAIYKIPQKSELHSPTQYDCREVLQS
jgi:hypothetical protein